MTTQKLVIIFIFLTSISHGQDFKPTSQSNYSLDFNNFLSGVKYAYEPLSDKDAIKSSYLLNLFDLMTSTPKQQTVSAVAGKTLIEQVKSLKEIIYIIEVN